MKQLFAIHLILILFLSCKPSKDELYETINSNIRKQIEAAAFRANEELKIYEFTTVDYSMVGENALDSIRKSQYASSAKMYFSLADASATLANSKTNTASVLNTIDHDLAILKAKEVEKEVKEARAYIDSGNNYLRKDSLLNIKIKNRKDDPKIYYYSKTFAKMTYGKQNILDTIHYVLDKDFKVVKL